MTTPGVGGASLVRGDALRIPLADNSVDLIVTSPPYFALRAYEDGGSVLRGQIGGEPTPGAFLDALWAVTAECWRVLKPTGSLFVNLGDKYAGSGGHNNSPFGGAHRGPASYTKASDGVRPKSLLGLPWRWVLGCIDGRGAPNGERWILRAELVWSKPNGMPESVTDRVRRSHEQFFHLTKNAAYYAAIDDLREPHATGSHEHRRSERTDRRAAAAARWGHRGDKNAQLPPQPGDHGAFHPLGRLPGSVWSIPTEPLLIPDELGIDHFAAFPTEWPRRLILGWSPAGFCLECGATRRAPLDPSVGEACDCATPAAPTRPAVVLDPFGGTGTVAMVARSLGRHGISLDLSADYVRLARWRVFDSSHASRVLRRTWTERQGVLL